MSNSSKAVRFMYGTCIGRFFLKIIMKLHMDRIVTRFLWSGASKPIIGRYAKRNGIELTKEQKDSFGSFRDFFVRTREPVYTDMTPGHLISPCDGWLSTYSIDENSCFSIKNSHYRIRDFLQDEELENNYKDGQILIFRLCASDYHHYCYIDNGYQGKNHHIPGVLHSVQPIACEKYPVYVLNKRSWCLLTTVNFGPVVQCEIGALVVGGIFNERENSRFSKGMEKGHFELAGSTIVLLFEPGQIKLNSEILDKLSESEEVQVKQGEWIGTAETINENECTDEVALEV